MAFRIVTNQKNRNATVLFTANSTLAIAGNNSVSDLAIDDEILTGAVITKAWYGCSDGSWWTVKRGANTVLVATSSNFLDFAGNGCPLTLDSAADLVAELNHGGGPNEATLLIELRKIGSGSSDY